MSTSPAIFFVGFGLKDDNFSRIVDAVQRAMGPHRAQGPRLGHAIMLQPAPALKRLWDGEIEWIELGRSGENMLEAARRLEVFLDELVMHTSGVKHLLSERHHDALDRDEVELAGALSQIAEMTARNPLLCQKPSFQPAIQMLNQYGWSQAVSTTKES